MLLNPIFLQTSFCFETRLSPHCHTYRAFVLQLSRLRLVQALRCQPKLRRLNPIQSCRNVSSGLPSSSFQKYRIPPSHTPLNPRIPYLWDCTPLQPLWLSCHFPPDTLVIPKPRFFRERGVSNGKGGVRRGSPKGV